MSNRCPDCNGEGISKGYRSKDVTRYLCKNCGRNYTDNPNIVQKANIEEDKTVLESEFTTIKISRCNKSWLDSLKVIPQEPYDCILTRLKGGFK